MLLRTAVTAAVAALLAGIAAPAVAQDWPSRPLRIIVVAAAGGLPDIAARTFAAPLSRAFGQPVVVENRAGGAGNIASDAVAKATPDGHTLLVTGMNQAINQILYPNPGFDYEKDLAPVAMLAESGMLIVASSRFPANNLREAIAIARQKPGAVSMGIGVLGSPNHVGAELIAIMGGVQFNPVSYKGIGAMMPDLLSGNLDMSIGAIPSVLPQVRAGKLKALAVTRPKRSAQAPDIVTAEESGLSGFDINSWIALMTTGGTPRPVVERLNSEARRIAQSPEVRDAFDKHGTETSQMSAAELGSFIRSEVQKWTPVLKNTKAATR